MTASHITALTDLELGLSDRAIRALADNMTARKLRPGQYAVRQGEPGDGLQIILDGRLDVVVHSPGGQELVFRTLSRGDAVGELTLVDGSARLASVRAATQASLLSISRDRFIELAYKHPELGLWLARICSEKTRRLSDWAEGTSFDDLGSRLAALLIEIASRDAPSGGESFEARITQQSLADRLGVTRESINRNLRAWESAGIVELGRGVVRITSRQALLGAAEA